jgi:hypothetical protein
MFVSRALKSVLVDLSLPKRRALFDFLRDPQFVKSKLTYLFHADREETKSSGLFLSLFVKIRCHWAVRFINKSKIKKAVTKNQKLKNVLHE